MTFPIFSTQPAGKLNLSLFDQACALLGATAVTPCTALTSGGLITLTPFSSAAPVSAVGNYQMFGAVADATVNASVTAAIASTPSLPAYLGAYQAPPGSITAGDFVIFAKDATLNGGVGGYHVILPPVPAAAVTGRQMRNALNAASVLLTVINGIPADPTDAINIDWQTGAVVLPGDALANAIQSILSYTDAQMTALFASAATYPR